MALGELENQKFPSSGRAGDGAGGNVGESKLNCVGG
jgi:hypothetical protein